MWTQLVVIILGVGLLLALFTIAWLISRDRSRSAAALLVTPPMPPREPSDFSPTFLALATALDDGILVLQPDRRIAFANASVGPLVGNLHGALQGQTLMASLRDYEADQAVERALGTGETESVTFHTPRSGRMLRLTCQPLSDGAGAVVVLRDLTQLAQLERARREMVANVSHELRTPLASMQLLVETLTREPPPNLARRMLGQIEDELTAMIQLVDELNELAQIESGRLVLNLRPTPASALVERVLTRLHPQAERKELQLLAEVDPDIPDLLIDEERVMQVLINLVHNALKWTPSGGTVTMLVQGTVPPPDPRTAQELSQLEAQGWIKVAVRDTGIGIPASELERVFERFYKVDRARTRDSGGTGLGLAIAKHLVERHGGRIWVESREERGSTFSLLLPSA